MYREGLGEINERIEAIRRAVARRAWLERSLEALGEQRDRVEAKVEALREQLDKEQRDVDKLEGKGLRALFAAMRGDKEERLDRERQEAFAERRPVVP